MPAQPSCPTTPPPDQLPLITPTHAADLRGYLARIPDPRHRRGIRHPLPAILGIAAAAVAAGARSFTAISEWATDAPQSILASLGARFDHRQQRHVPPDETTLRRVIGLLDGDALDDILTAWLAHRATLTAIAVDGKSLRGTFPRTGGTGVHLFSAVTHEDGIVLAQRQVPVGTSEIAAFQPVLDGIDLAGRVVTADALHTAAVHARYLHTRGADYVFTVKENQSKLHTQLDSLPWHQAPCLHYVDRGHGRTEHRSITVLPPATTRAFRISTFRTRGTRS